MNLDPQQKKYLLIGGAVALGIYLGAKLIKNKPNQQNDSSLNNETSSATILDENKILKIGSKGNEVVELQRILKKDYNAYLGTTGVNKDGIDGVFGAITLAGLIKAKKVASISLKDL